MFPSLDQAIGQFEGYGTPGTIATRQNNPGNLAYGPFAQSQGATGAGSNNIAIFPDTKTGFDAMDQLIQNYAQQGYSIGPLINAWAPGNAPGNTPQSTQNYVNYVAGQTGSTPNTPVSALQKGNNALANAGSVLGSILGGAVSGGNPGTMASGSVNGGLIGQSASDKISSVTSGFSFGRVAAILLGLILIAGAVYLFKPTQEFAKGVGRKFYVPALAA